MTAIIQSPWAYHSVRSRRRAFLKSLTLASLWAASGSQVFADTPIQKASVKALKRFIRFLFSEHVADKIETAIDDSSWRKLDDADSFHTRFEPREALDLKLSLLIPVKPGGKKHRNLVLEIDGRICFGFDKAESGHSLNSYEMLQLSKSDELARFKALLAPLGSRKKFDDDDDGDTFRKALRQYYGEKRLKVTPLYSRTFTDGDRNFRAFGITDQDMKGAGLIICETAYKG